MKNCGASTSRKRVAIFSADSKDAILAKKVEFEFRDHGIEVLLINIFDYINTDVESGFNISHSILDEIKKTLSIFSPEELYVCVHGLYENVDTCYHHDFDNPEELQVACSVYELGNILKTILPLTLCSIELLVCYGARTSNYQSNHIEGIHNLNILDSFSYRLFALLVSHGFTSMQMSAYLTAVKYENGRVLVDHEDAYNLRRQRDNLASRRIKIQHKMNALSDNDSEIEQLFNEDFELLSQQGDLDTQIEAHMMRDTYGKINYKMTDNNCIISMVHGDQTNVLYEGELKVTEEDIQKANSNDNCLTM